MTCSICLNPKRKTRFKSSRLELCQWCVTELIKGKDDTPNSIIKLLRLNYKNNEVAKIWPIKLLANSRPTPPIYPEAELQQASSASLREAAHKEGILTSLYRSLVNDEERIKEAERIKLRKQGEIIAHYGANKESFRQQLISIEQAKRRSLELEASLPNRIEEYITNHLSSLRSTTEQLKSKSDRLLRAYLLGLINADKVPLDRPDEDENARLRDYIKSQDGHACVICHKTSSNSELHVHHIIPLYKFGTNKEQNLVTLCYSCHNKQHKAFKVARAKSDNPSPRKSTFIAVDIKTTGISNQDEIIEIGAALFENGKVIKNYQSLMHTSRYVRLIPEISKQMVDSAPKPDVVFPEFLSFIGKSNLVVHNATFVMPFLQKYAKNFGTTIPNYITDTLSISKKKLPQLDGDKIFSLTNHFKAKRTPSNRALDDSIATGFIFLRLASIKDETPIPQLRKYFNSSASHIKKTNKVVVPRINNPEKNKKSINKPTLITGNGTLEDAFRADSQKNYTTAFQIYWRLAKQGVTIAQFNLGWMYANGQGVKKDSKEAVLWYRKAAEQGHAGGQCNLGYMYSNGRGVKQDYEKAVLWYRKAAEQGNARAQCNLGWMCEVGRGIAQDYEQAMFWYEQAADQDNADAQCNLGWMCEVGRGIEQDYEQAVFWYEQAADQGNARAQCNLGVMYANGRGVDEDNEDYDEQAVFWYRKAAVEGDATAQCNLGWMYNKGRGVVQDDKQAVFWYRRAAAQGNATAQCNLGWMNQYGRGVKQDDQYAVLWYRRAAAQGNATAQCNLGWMYENGHGVKQDCKQAVSWYSKAAEQGNATAQGNLDRLEKTGLYINQETAYTQQIDFNKNAAFAGQPTKSESHEELVDQFHKALAWYLNADEVQIIYKILCKNRYLEFQNKAKSSASADQFGHKGNRHPKFKGESYQQLVDEYHEALVNEEIKQAHKLYKELLEYQFAEFQLRSKSNTQSKQVGDSTFDESVKYQLTSKGIPHEKLVDEYHKALANGGIEQAHILYEELIEHQFSEFQLYT